MSAIWWEFNTPNVATSFIIDGTADEVYPKKLPHEMQGAHTDKTETDYWKCKYLEYCNMNYFSVFL